MKRCLALLATAAILVAACGNSAADESATSDEVATETTATDNSSESDTEPQEDTADDSEADGDDDASVTFATLGEPNWDELQTHVIPALGGMTLGVADPQIVHYDANLLTVRSSFAPTVGAVQPTMTLALVSQFPDGGPIDDIDELTRGVAIFGSAEPTGEMLSAFGLEMERWAFVAADPDARTSPLFSAFPRGTGGPTAWNPFPFSELYLAETEGGVLAFGWSGQTEAELAEAKKIFDQVAPSIELANQDFAALGAVDAPVMGSLPPENPPAPVVLPDDWDAPFGGVGVPVDPGTYTSNVLGTPARFTVGEDWDVQPNFPAFFVLSGRESIGPGDRGVEFRIGVTEIVPVNGAYQAAGDGIDFTDLRALSESPPENMMIEVTDIEVAGQAALQADIEIVPSGSCDASEVCEYIMFTRYAWPGHSLRAGYVYRVLHLEEGLAEPLTITMAAVDSAWFDIAQPVIDSLEFESAG